MRSISNLTTKIEMK